MPLPVAAHELEGCPVPAAARIDLTALGDFSASNANSESLALDTPRAPLPFPAETRALQASVADSTSDQRYIAYSERQRNRLDFLLWPEGVACDLFHGTYLVQGEGEALGYAPSSGLFMLAGSNRATSSSVVGALLFDSRRGLSRLLEPRSTLREPRAFASITQFAEKLLVAGGENPIHEPGKAPDVRRASAEVFDPESQRFEPDPIILVEPTTRHGAATLASGETVLVGGENAASGASNFIQLVSPVTRRALLIGTLNVGRSRPQVLRLSDDRLFIAGGEDESGQPVTALEWRGADGSSLPAPFDGSLVLPPRFQRTFVATTAGSVLALGGCADRAPMLGEDCSTWCRRGCLAEPGAPDDAFWISAEGRVERVILPFSAARAELLPGSDGRPWLVASQLDDAGRPKLTGYALYRFDPWHVRFELVRDRFAEASSAEPLRFQTTGTDAFVWFEPNDAGAVLRGARFGTRSMYSNDVALVTLRDVDDASRPAHLAPSRPPGSDLHYDSQLGALEFSAENPEFGPICAYIADAAYADFSARISVSSDALPRLRVGPHSLVDPDADCPLPSPVRSAGRASVLEFARRNERLSLRLDDVTSECDVGTGQLAIGLCSSRLGPVRVTALSVMRERR